MPTRCKTVEFVFPTDQSTLAAGTKRALASQTVYLPESGKVFRSVTLEIGFTDHVTAASSATSFALEILLGSGSADTVTITDTVTNSGESSVHHVSRDVTSYFTANWSGTSMSARAAITVGTNATNNHWAKLRITYDYDDASTTHVKTIWYPIETTRTLLSTSYQTIGGALAMPPIKGGASILPEANATVRQVWIELVGNEGTSDTTDFNLDLRLATDSTEQLTLYRVEAALATPGWLHAIWDVTASSLSAAQAFEAKLTGASNRVPNLCGWVGITYEFDPATTTTVWNSLMLPAFDGEDQHGATTSVRKAQHVKDVWIAEPATITLQPSSIVAFYSDTQEGSAMSLWVDGQSARSFTTTATGAGMALSQRIDAGGTSGLGISLARGRNHIKINEFGNVSSPGAYSAVTGFVLLNYTSGKASAGVGTHNQTRHFALGWFQADALSLEYSSDTTAPKTPALPESSYFLNAVALQAAWLSSVDNHQAVRVQVQRSSGEGPDGDGVGWANVYHAAIGSVAENWQRWTLADCTRLFRRWAGDVDTTRMDVEVPRRWMFLNFGGVWVGAIGLLVTYHAITRTARGTVRGSAGDGSGLTVNLSRTSGERVLSTTTKTGGVYDATWFDDTEPLVADVYEDESHLGRSIPFYADAE